LSGRTPYIAWVSYVSPLREALRCITPERFILKESTTGLMVDTNYAVLLNDMNSVPLKGPTSLYLVTGQNIRFSESHLGSSRDRYQVQILSYTYGFTDQSEHGEQNCSRSTGIIIPSRPLQSHPVTSISAGACSPIPRS
jgi:hypothetical protein